jgi:hypothetical protein
MQSYNPEYIRLCNYLVILRSPFTIYFKLEKVMVLLQIHDCVHMLYTQHGRPLSAQTQSKLILIVNGNKIIAHACCFMQSQVITMVKQVELQLLELKDGCSSEFKSHHPKLDLSEAIIACGSMVLEIQ